MNFGNALKNSSLIWDEKSIRYYEQWIADARERVAAYKSGGAFVRDGVELVEHAIMRGDRKAIKQLTEKGEQLNIDILKILANRL